MLKKMGGTLLAAAIAGNAGAVGANNLFNKYPDGVNPALLADQRAAGDNAAVNVLPSFSPIGINGGYYYVRANYKF